jgi:hypothetical protein
MNAGKITFFLMWYQGAGRKGLQEATEKQCDCIGLSGQDIQRPFKS